VNIVQHVKNKAGCWVYVSAKVAPDAKLTIKQRLRKGSYFINWREGKTRRYEKAGKDLGEAVEQANLKLLQLQARAKGLDWHFGNAADPGRLTLRESIDGFLEELKLTHRPTSYELFAFDLNEFARWGKHIVFVDQMTRMDLLKFKEWVQKSGRSERTAGNKMGRVNQFHRSVLKIDPGKGLTTVRDIKFVAKQVEVYSTAELERFFSECSPDQRLLFTTLLQTGLRMKEAMYLYWSDIDFDHKVLRVIAKAEFDFMTKTWEERTVTLPSKLTEKLQKAKEDSPHKLVFPTRSGRPNDKWLYVIKRIAKRAALNCGNCSTCLQKNECEHWYTHKFRATFATTLLRAGVDLASVQYQMGHKDLESTMRYLAPIEAKSKVMQAKINAAWS
jgi:integrase